MPKACYIKTTRGCPYGFQNDNECGSGEWDRVWHTEKGRYVDVCGYHNQCTMCPKGGASHSYYNLAAHWKRHDDAMAIIYRQSWDKRMIACGECRNKTTFKSKIRALDRWWNNY